MVDNSIIAPLSRLSSLPKLFVVIFICGSWWRLRFGNSAICCGSNRTYILLQANLPLKYQNPVVRVLLVVYVCVFGGGHCCCILPQQRQAAFPNGAIPYSHFGIHTLDTTHTHTDIPDWHRGLERTFGARHMRWPKSSTWYFSRNIQLFMWSWKLLPVLSEKFSG